MKKILITGATDGIGRETAKALIPMGHQVLLHGRNPDKLVAVQEECQQAGGKVEAYLADFMNLSEVKRLAEAVLEKHHQLDVVINNAGVFRTPKPITTDGFDSRFVVNTIAPYLLTKRLLPILGTESRVVNLSSAAQAAVSPSDLRASSDRDDLAYAQSKLALTMWSVDMAQVVGDNGPVIVAVNPQSFLGSKMVKEAYGMAGGDVRIGAEILCRAALSDEFANASGKYFDNDIGRFAEPHPDAQDLNKCREMSKAIEAILGES